MKRSSAGAAPGDLLPGRGVPGVHHLLPRGGPARAQAGHGNVSLQHFQKTFLSVNFQQQQTKGCLAKVDPHIFLKVPIPLWNLVLLLYSLDFLLSLALKNLGRGSPLVTPCIRQGVSWCDPGPRPRSPDFRSNENRSRFQSAEMKSAVI